MSGKSAGKDFVEAIALFLMLGGSPLALIPIFGQINKVRRRRDE